mgnify:FL=1
MRLSNYMTLRGISRGKKKGLGWRKGRHLTKAHKINIGEGVRKSHKKRNSTVPTKSLAEMTWPQARRAGLSRMIWKSAKKNRK